MYRFIITPILFVTFQVGFAQKKLLVPISGTVYLAQGLSSGVVDGGTTMYGPAIYAKRLIYITNASKWITLRTDSKGVFSVKLEPGKYTIERDSLEKKGNKMYFYDEIEVKKGGGPYKVNFKEVEFGE